MKKLYIYCCGGMGRVTLELANAINIVKNRWNDISFVDDYCELDEINNVRMIKFKKVLELIEDGNIHEFIIASGEPKIKERIYNDKIRLYGLKLTTLIHPNIYIPSTTIVGHGSIIMNGAVIDPNVNIGNNVIINNNVTVCHDTKILDFTTISPGCIISGGVYIGESNYIGAGTIIRDEVKIGSNSIIGIGSLVLNDVPDDVVVYGNPSKIIKKNIDNKIFK